MDTPSAQDLTTTEEHRRRRWLARGFNPDEPMNEFFGCFTKAEAMASLSESTRFWPKAVFLTDDRDGEVNIPVVIDLARPLYIPGDIGDGEQPDWYFEGWILDPRHVGIRRVRIHVSTTDGDAEFADDDFFSWQWIKDDEAIATESLAWSFT